MFLLVDYTFVLVVLQQLTNDMSNFTDQNSEEEKYPHAPWWHAMRYWIGQNNVFDTPEMPDVKAIINEQQRLDVKSFMEGVEQLENPFPVEVLSSLKGNYYAFETCRSLILSQLDQVRREISIRK